MSEIDKPKKWTSPGTENIKAQDFIFPLNRNSAPRHSSVKNARGASFLFSPGLFFGLIKK